MQLSSKICLPYGLPNGMRLSGLLHTIVSCMCLTQMQNTVGLASQQLCTYTCCTNCSRSSQ